jgi:hypothetical protein
MPLFIFDLHSKSDEYAVCSHSSAMIGPTLNECRMTHQIKNRIKIRLWPRSRLKAEGERLKAPLVEADISNENTGTRLSDYHKLIIVL